MLASSNSLLSMSPVEKVLENLIGPLSLPFTLAIGVLWALDLYTHYHDDGRNHKQLTGLMTGVGILGTFFGVVVGLQDFDPSNISDSISPLLEGLKVSFSTSVAGLFAAISTEVIERTFSAKRAKIGDPVADSLNEHMFALTDVLESAKKANESVANNVAGLRTEMRDEAREVKEALNDALEKLSKGATEEIISALREVISDFNRNLTEQFGDNFTKLNEACLLLVKWQEDFKNSVETSTNALSDASSAMDECRDQFSHAIIRKKEFLDVAEKSGRTIELMEKHQKILAAQIDGQEETLMSLKKTLEKASTSLCEIEKTATNATSGFENLLADHAKAHEQISQNITEVNGKFEKGNDDLQKHLGASLTNLEQTLVSLTKEFGSAYQNYLDGLKRLQGNP